MEDPTVAVKNRFACNYPVTTVCLSAAMASVPAVSDNRTGELLLALGLGEG